MYAIAFDLDTDALQQAYGSDNWRNAYEAIRAAFEKHGFNRQQGSVYFGNQEVTPVHCVLAVQEACRRYPWFRFVVRDIRMLRIEENNDLLPAITRQGELPFDPDRTSN
jgi:virulence-associated protein VapD